MSKTISLGKVSISPKGRWEENRSYEKLDAVYHNNSFWIACEANKASEPVEGSAYWMLSIDNSSIKNAIEAMCTTTPGTNLLDRNSMLSGKYMTNTSATIFSGDYYLTDYIEVSEGQKITYQATISGVRKKNSMRYVTAFDENRAILSSKGSAATSEYTVGEGVKYVRITLAETYISTTYEPAIVASGELQEYQDYGYVEYSIDGEMIKGSVFNDTKVSVKDLGFAKCTNYFDKNDPDIMEGYYIDGNKLEKNSSYCTSGYIEIEPGETYLLNAGYSNQIGKSICQYDKNKKYLATVGTTKLVSEIKADEKAKYIRISYPSGLTQLFSVVNKTDGFSFGLEKKYLVSDSVLSYDSAPPIFIPDTIYVAVGRTIDIYNRGVCPFADGYHFRWYGNIGKAYKNKYRITGTSARKGSHTLTLEIYSKDGTMVFEKDVTVKIANNILTSSVNICPIGGTLTADRYWLSEVKTLSGNKINYVGTVESQYDCYHEGRVDWNLDTYVNYDSDPIDGLVNPFYDGESFDWGHYVDNNEITPTAVQLFFGENDIVGTDASEFIENMKTVIDSIRSRSTTIPIFVVLIPFKGEQDGLTSYEYKYKIDTDIVESSRQLYEAIKDMSYNKLYFVPVMQCFDSEHNYETSTITVNPRSTLTETVHTDSYIPSQEGFEQMADVMFSAICGAFAS